MSDTDAVKRRAWEMHRQNGHPDGYDGPCWGPTTDDVAQARQEEALARVRISVDGVPVIGQVASLPDGWEDHGVALNP